MYILDAETKVVIPGEMHGEFGVDAIAGIYDVAARSSERALPVERSDGPVPRIPGWSVGNRTSFCAVHLPVYGHESS